MCYWVLPLLGVPIARSTIQSITADEMKTDTVISELKVFHDAIKPKLGALHGDADNDT